MIVSGVHGPPTSPQLLEVLIQLHDLPVSPEQTSLILSQLLLKLLNMLVSYPMLLFQHLKSLQSMLQAFDGWTDD
jgi:hypothetical protein